MAGTAGRPSETQLQSQLQRTRPAQLIQGIQVSQRRIQRGLRTSERGRSRAPVIMDISEARVVENVERLAPELQTQTFREVKIPPQGKVNLRDSKTSQGISRQRAIVPSGDTERFIVDGLVTRILWSVCVERLTRQI